MPQKEYPFPNFSNEERIRVHALLAKSSELEGLLAPFRDETGHLTGRIAFLLNEEGKRILEIARNELRLNWSDLRLVLERSRSGIKDAVSHHGAYKKREAHLDWSPERIALVQKFYEQSQTVKVSGDSA